MNLVFDSSALVAYLGNEPGAELAESLLLDPTNVCVVHALNLAEVYYLARRRAGEDKAQAALIMLRKTGIVVREDLDERFWTAAARIKADYARVSLADTLCISLANRLAGEVVTSDRHEIEPLAAAAICRVQFIRSA